MERRQNLPRIPRTAALALLAGAATLGGAGVAFAAPTAPILTAPPATPTKAATATFNWSASTPTPPAVGDPTPPAVTRYEGGLTAAAAPPAAPGSFGLALTSGALTLPATDGTAYFHVRAIEVDPDAPATEVPSTWTTYAITVDRTPPAVARTSPLGAPPAWYTAPFTLSWTCTDASTVTGCPNPLTQLISADTANGSSSGTATDAAGNATPWSFAYKLDKTPPTVAGTASTAANALGWRRADFTINWTCTDATSGCATAPPPTSVTAESVNGSVPSPAVNDVAGNAAPANPFAYKLDKTPPPATNLASPSNDATVAAVPTLRWSEVVDTAGSGFSRFQVIWANAPGGAQVLQTLNDPTGKSTSYTPEVALPQVTPIEWFVRSFDKADNTADSAHRSFIIDDRAPVAPAIQTGPPDQTNDATPSFSWSGGQPTFRWKLVPAGATDPLQAGSGATTSATLNPIPDGTYAFFVTQVSAAGVEGAEASWTFTVDTAAPAAPQVNGPTTPATDLTQSFDWSGEPHATYTWRVIGANGSLKQGPVSQKETSATTTELSPSTYSFELRQTDRAGNTSAPAVIPFTVTGPKELVKPVSNTAGLPLSNTSRLKPKAGSVLPTRRPVLQWTRGPRGTTLYNLQLYRVVRNAKTRKAKVVKVLSTFPRARQYRVPTARTRAATCYVWRVWPYLGNRFSAKPVGVSSFCVASKQSIKAKAKARAAKAKAKKSGR
ncbi:MAG: hypothetical protein AB7V42_05900 [Thermoleophilia bacterium]